ncbi:MAG: 50S ribosomal protein L15e [Candidatus Aenigmatarchaeota archaeon]|nr:MAG: 50S ribosomal protein L15e [Candidatus Aenigmarchaeota archaeon]
MVKAYSWVAQIWKKPKQGLGELYRQRLIQWRKEKTVTRVEKPTRIDRARALGYKAKQGFVVVRVKVKKGARKTPKLKGGRRPKRRGRFFSLEKSKQVVAEEKAARKYPNCEVLNSYWVGEDGNHTWYEVILVERAHPSIKADKEIKWITENKHRGRAFRGKTSAGRKSRGLRN